jgi:hypothetical protein
VAISGGELKWPGAPGVSFTILHSADCVSWNDSASQPGVEGTNSYIDPDPPTGRAFYWVKLDP